MVNTPSNFMPIISPRSVAATGFARQMMSIGCTLTSSARSGKGRMIESGMSVKSPRSAAVRFMCRLRMVLVEIAPKILAPSSIKPMKTPAVIANGSVGFESRNGGKRRNHHGARIAATSMPRLIRPGTHHKRSLSRTILRLTLPVAPFVARKAPRACPMIAGQARGRNGPRATLACRR